MNLYKEMTRKDAIEKYGSEACKSHFQKYNKFKNKNLEIALIKTLEQHYEQVEKEGRGDNTIYKLYNKKNHPSARADKRLNNGRWSEIGKIFPIQILCSLFEEDKKVLNNEKSNTKTYIQWTSYFGLIDEVEFNLYEYEHQPEMMNRIIVSLTNNGILAYEERTLINDMIGLISKKRNLVAKSLQRLEKIGIIECIPMYKAYAIQDENSEIIDLSKKEFDKLQRFRKSLLDTYGTYGISEWQAMTYINSPKAREFRKEWKGYLEEFKENEGLKIQNIFIQYRIILIDDSTSLDNCVEKYCDFFEIHADVNFAISKTKERMALLIKSLKKDYYERIFHHYNDEFNSLTKSVYEIAEMVGENPFEMAIDALPRAKQNRIHLYRDKDYKKLIIKVEKYLRGNFRKIKKNNA